MLFVILFVGTCIRAMLEAKGKSWAIMLKSYCTKIHSPTLSFRGIIVHFQIFIQDSGKKRRGQGIIWSKSHWSRQWISSSKKDRPKQGKKLKIYLNSRDVRWDSHTPQISFDQCIGWERNLWSRVQSKKKGWVSWLIYTGSKIPVDVLWIGMTICAMSFFIQLFPFSVTQESMLWSRLKALVSPCPPAGRV